MESTRGEIYNRQRAKQINNFNGLSYGKITPTDIDGLLDMHGKCAILIEMKYKDAPLPFGQKLALERVVSNSKVASICIVAAHDLPVDLDVPVADCIVREYFYHGKWHEPKEQYTVKRMCDEFVAKHAPECLHLNGDRS